jgi:hypothetical protein
MSDHEHDDAAQRALQLAQGAAEAVATLSATMRDLASAMLGLSERLDLIEARFANLHAKQCAQLARVIAHINGQDQQRAFDEIRDQFKAMAPARYEPALWGETRAQWLEGLMGQGEKPG